MNGWLAVLSVTLSLSHEDCRLTSSPCTHIRDPAGSPGRGPFTSWSDACAGTVANVILLVAVAIGYASARVDEYPADRRADPAGEREPSLSRAGGRCHPAADRFDHVRELIAENRRWLPGEAGEESHEQRPRHPSCG
jgi:hypothetical protein